MPTAHRNKNHKKCDETVKKRGEMATGAFFEPKKRRWISLSRKAKIKDDEIVAKPRPEGQPPSVTAGRRRIPWQGLLGGKADRQLLLPSLLLVLVPLELRTRSLPLASEGQPADFYFVAEGTKFGIASD